MKNHWLVAPGQVVEVEGPVLVLGPAQATLQESPREIDCQDVSHEQRPPRIHVVYTRLGDSPTE